MSTSREAKTETLPDAEASSPAPPKAKTTISSERARWLVNRSWAGLTPEQRQARMLPARLAAARRILAQVEAQTPQQDAPPPGQDGGAP